MCALKGARRTNGFGRELLSRTEVGGIKSKNDNVAQE